MDLQIVYIFILAIITVTLVAVAIYVILILREVRGTIQKANEIMEDFESVTNAFSNPMSIIMGVIDGYKAIKSLKKDE